MPENKHIPGWPGPHAKKPTKLKCSLGVKEEKKLHNYLFFLDLATSL